MIGEGSSRKKNRDAEVSVLSRKGPRCKNADKGKVSADGKQLSGVQGGVATVRQESWELQVGSERHGGERKNRLQGIEVEE